MARLAFAQRPLSLLAKPTAHCVRDPSRRRLPPRLGYLAYGLTRDELRYILDPADVMGPDYPSETFRVLKDNEMMRYGEYRTRRLVLEAWDSQTWSRSAA